MSQNKYIVKSLTPWMIDELIAFSKLAKYDLILLRKPDDFYLKSLIEIEKNGVRIIYDPFKGSFQLRKLYIVLLFFFKNIFNFRPDYNSAIGVKSIFWFMKLDMKNFSSDSQIHAQFATQPAVISYLIKKYFSGKPNYSFTFHAYDIYFKNRWFKLLLDHSLLTFSISNFNIEYVTKNYGVSDKYKLCRLGVFKSSGTNSESKSHEFFTLGLLSWFQEKKGIFYLLDAMKKLNENEFTKVRLILAGDGPLKDKIIDFIKDNQLSDMIEYVGKINGSAKNDFYDSLDAFILPSIKLKDDQDGIPVVLMEAISKGLPIISTDVSGIPEICIDNYNGCLINERSAEEIYHAILKLYDEINFRKQCAINALELSKEYDIELNSKNKINMLQWA